MFSIFRVSHALRSLATAAVLALPALTLPSAAAAAAAEGAAPAKPNVVIIYTDDQNLDQIGCYGGQETPNIDRLATEGLRFDRYYVGTALCAPSRYAMQNGGFASTAPHSLREYPAGGPISLSQKLGDVENRPPEEWNLPTGLKAAGYTTGFVGKYHLGFMGERVKFGNADGDLDDPQMLADLRHNFELAQQGAYAGGYDYAEALWHDNPQMINFPKVVRYHNQDWITWKALEFLETHQEKPFFLVINPTLVHYPATRESLEQDRSITPVGRVDVPEVQPSRADVLKRAEAAGLGDSNHGAGVIWLDDAVGVITQKLDDLGLTENTLILFISDHSGKGKWTCYNGLSGAIARWPGKIAPGRVSTDLVQNVDIAPTVLELCGASLPENGQMVQGISVADHLLDETQPSPRNGAFMEIFYQRAVISDDNYKYIAVRFPEDMRQQMAEGKQFTLRGQEVKEGGKGKAGPATPDELYNLNEDPNERKNLAEDPAYAEVLERLKGLMAEKCRQLPHSFGEFTE